MAHTPSTNPATTPVAEPVADRTLDLEFDFNDFHCFIDVDEVLAQLSATGRAAVLADTDRVKLDAFDDYDWRDLAERLTTHVDEADEVTVEALETDADTIRLMLHAPDCDCAQLNHQWFLEMVTEQVDDLYRDTRYLMAFYNTRDADYGPDLLTTTFALPELRDRLDVDSYDRIALTLDPDNGSGMVAWYDRGGRTGYDLVVLTDPDRIELAEHLAGNRSGDDGDHPVTEIDQLDDAVLQVYLALAKTEIADPNPDEYRSGQVYTLSELDAEDFFKAMKALDAATLTLPQVAEMAALARNWHSGTADMVAALRAAAA